MFSEFDRYSAAQQLLQPTDRILAAVSGGADSMTLLHILAQKKYCTAAAHCNFMLRGKESDRDEKTASDFAKRLNIQFFVKNFDTLNFARRHHISVQMAARRLRYEWFSEIAAEHSFTKIAIAHNANDSVETFFVNLMRGTGLSGLAGIAPKQGKIIRPLLFAMREQILDYAVQNDIPFVEDSSNASDKYLRNAIRHNITPALQKIAPAFVSTMLNNMKRLAQAKDALAAAVSKAKQSAVSGADGSVCIAAEKILQYSPFYIHALLKEYGFSGKIIGGIIDALRGGSGKMFYSPSFQLVCNRGSLMLRPLAPAPDHASIMITENDIGIQVFLSPAETLTCSIVERIGVDFSLGENCAWLDFECLRFPLEVRRQRSGDIFIPLGMSGRKKLSDFFIDGKFDRYQKQEQWLLCSGGDIVWVVGRRLGDRCKITAATQKVLCIQYKKSAGTLARG